jgi:hypothetical protein
MSRDAPVTVLDREIAEEKASALGRAGRRLEAALAGLKDAAGEGRPPLVEEAADALFAYLVQREAMGLRDQRTVLREFGVPAEVVARMGVVRR